MEPINICYYCFALMFVLFDVEATGFSFFLLAARLETYGVFGLVEMAIFIFILALVLRWRKGLLRWV